MNQVFRTLVCKAESATDGTITAIASTPDADRMGDIVAPSWDLKAFRANPVIMHNHNYEGEIVAKALEIDLVGDTLMMRIQFDESETNPVGRRLANQYREGFASAFSVGFSPGKTTERSKLPTDHDAYQAKGGGLFFENSQLLEVSAVSIPANPHALAVRAKRWGLGNEAPAAAPDIEGKHVLEVVEDADAGTVTITYQMEAPEAPAEEEPTEEPAAEEEAAAEDEDQLMALRSMVRDELLVLLGSHDDEDVQHGLDLFIDSTPAEEPDSFEALFNLGA